MHPHSWRYHAFPGWDRRGVICSLDKLRYGNENLALPSEDAFIRPEEAVKIPGVVGRTEEKTRRNLTREKFQESDRHLKVTMPNVPSHVNDGGARPR